MIKAKHIKGVNSNGYVLTTNGSGVVSWAAASGGGSRPTVTEITASPYTIGSSPDASISSSELERVYLCGTNASTVTLPTAVGNEGFKIQIKNRISSAITVNTTSSQTIDGSATSVSITNENDSLTFISDDANWFII